MSREAVVVNKTNEDKIMKGIGEVETQASETNNTHSNIKLSNGDPVVASNKKHRKRKNKKEKGLTNNLTTTPAIPKIENLISKTFQDKLATVILPDTTVISARALDFHKSPSFSINSSNKILNEATVIMGKPKAKTIEQEINKVSENLGNKLVQQATQQDVLVSKKELAIKKPEESQSTEKTREDIKAEREAKKRAKQASKLNKSSPIQTIPTESVILSPTTQHLEKKIEAIQISNEKKPTLSKAERRAIQEAQRAAKATKLSNELVNPKKAAIITRPSTNVVTPGESQQKLTNINDSKKKSVKSVTTTNLKECKVKLFNHLEFSQKEKSCFLNNHQIHPTIVRLGEQYAQRTIVGSNARCIAFLNALRTVIQEYETPAKKEFARSLEAAIKNCVDHLQKCRPLAVSISNAYKHIKFVLTQLPTDQPESELKEHLIHFIDTYIENQIGKAAQAISISVQEKISNGDVILTFGCSSLINFIFEEAHRRGVDFRVVVVDSRPFSEGQELLRRLVTKEISCTYVLINAVGFIMPEVSKVLLGAHALLANGYVMARTGTAQVALVARSFNVPVLVCCETHKFSERVQTDAIVYNELGNPDDLIIDSNCRLSNWQTQNKLSPLNLNYDITPPELVTAVVTEVAILPCTSVPVILRIKPTEIGY